MLTRILLSGKDLANRYRTGLAVFGHRAPWPRIGTTLAIGIGALTSLAPGLLPRTASAQAVLTALLATCALAVAGLVRYVLGHWDFDNNPALRRLRPPLTLTTTALVVAAAIQAGHWQNGLRAGMGTAPIGVGYWTISAAGAALILGVLIGSVRTANWLFRTARSALRTPGTAASALPASAPRG